MSNTPYRVGIIGYGWAAQAHIQAIAACPNAEVHAVYSKRPLQEDSLRQQHQQPIRLHSSLDSLLQDPEIDVISITGYPADHHAQVLAAAKAGKHLIIEKPLVLQPEHLEEVQQACRDAGVQACVCFECRWSNQMQSSHALIQQGLLGDIHYAEVDYQHGIGPWYGQYRWNTTKEQGGSSLLSAGCHAMDALLMLMNSKPTEVTTYSTQSQHPDFQAYEYPTTTVSMIRFENGSIGKVASIIDCLQPYYFRTQCIGSKGSLLDNKFHSTTLHSDKTAWSTLSMKMLDSGDVSDHPYQSQFEAFFTALEKDQPMPLTSLQEASQSFELIFAADESARTGKTITLT